MISIPLRTRTVFSNDWYVFYITDIPVLLDDSVFILFAKQRSPKLLYSEILYGCEEFGVFEGDIIYADGMNYLISYNAGFSAVDARGLSRDLYTFRRIQVVGDYTNHPLGESFVVPAKHLFKADNTVFTIKDITCSCDDILYLRGNSQAVPIDKLRVSCRMSLDAVKLFFGDCVGDATVNIKGGRIVTDTVDGIMDLRRRTLLHGYNTGDFNRK